MSIDTSSNTTGNVTTASPPKDPAKHPVKRPPKWVVSYVLDPLERAGTTFVQHFVSFLMATGAGGLLVTQEWGAAADTAGFAAIISLLMSVASFKVSKKSDAVDLALRIMRTFIASVVGTVAAAHVSHTVVHADWKGAVALALPVALSAALKGIAALSLEKTAGASLIPKSWRVEPEPVTAPTK